jgi:hypothetical protein
LRDAAEGATASPAPAGWRPEDTTINFEGGNVIYSFKTGQQTR